VFRTYEQIRRPRVAEMHRIADRNGDVRTKIRPWKLRLLESGITTALSIYRILGLERLGLGQGLLSIDVTAGL
jgi:hypothetical protein